MQDCGIHHLISSDAHLDQTALLDEDVAGLCCLIGTSRRNGIPSVTWDDVESLETDAPPNLSLSERDLAYILYTSGSTGTPKGIVHTHRSGMSFALWAAETYQLTSADRVSNHAPLHFDLSTFDFFAAAYAGATTVIVPEALTKFPADLGRLMERERLTVWYSVPYALIQLLERGRLSTLDLSALRWILFAGEVFPVKHLRRLLEALPHVRFSNLFGPTETNVCTYYHVPVSLPESDDPIPIGTPCANVESLIVNDDDQLVRDGEAGELLIRGGVVMDGYWGRPDLSKRSFFKPVSGGPGDYYRTGDLVAALPDGNLKYLGRKDRQIKTRGYRVELDEVEAALLSLAGVEEAAAYPVPDGQGSRLIEAAVTAKEGTTLTAADVMRHVAACLPAYAVPTRLRVLEAFPRTSTGKINRREIEAQSA
jgi:amino acid adenylation domain-containing protein